MEGTKVTDLDAKLWQQEFKIVLLGSRFLLEQKEKDVQNIFLAHPHLMERVFQDFMRFDLIHVGTLRLLYSHYQMEAREFVSSYSYVGLEDELKMLDFSKRAVTVLKIGSGHMKFFTSTERSEYPALNLFLLLKQMVPELKTVNYIDFKHTQFICDRFVTGDLLNKVRKFGVISLLKNHLWERLPAGNINYHSLGLTLSPLNISLDQNNLSMLLWLRFLTVKWWEYQQQNLNALKGKFLGPKMG